MPVAQQRKAMTASLPSPIGGWNARDSLAEMNQLDAVQMVNFFPTPTDVTLRKGYTKISTGITGEVYSLMNYSNPTGNTLFASSNSAIYDTSTLTATSVLTGITSGKWVHSIITTAGGTFLAAVNNTDPMVVYDGTRWQKSATTATAQTISTINRGGTGNLTATLTTSVAHGLVTGNTVTVSGATPSEFNGTYRITVTGTTTFTYTMASTPAANATVVGSYTVLGIFGATPSGGGTPYSINSNKFINVNLFKNPTYGNSLTNVTVTMYAR